MAFGQQSGPPASGRQLKDLEALLQQAGYAGFRDARGPLGFNQRQGGGKFTSEEAAAFIEQLEAEADGSTAEPEVEPIDKSARAAAPARRPAAKVVAPDARAAERRDARQAAAAEGLPPHVLARELEKRGWILVPPEDYVPPAVD